MTPFDSIFDSMTSPALRRLTVIVACAIAGPLTGCMSTPVGTATIFQTLEPKRDFAKEQADQEKREKWQRQEAHRLAQTGVRRANLTSNVASAVGNPRHDMSRGMPEHAAALVAEGHLKPKHFVLAGSRTNPAHVECIRGGAIDLLDNVCKSLR